MNPRVKVSLGWTRNMGNFESLRVDLGIEDDARDGETVTTAFERVFGKVEDLLLQQVEKVEKEIKEAQKG